MTDTMQTNAPMDEVRGLVDERGRYEGWIAALETRRASAPAHVLDRVRQDYDGRLRGVLDRLESHAGALRADEAALAARHQDQQRALDERRDQLTEVELRTLVGEYSPEESERQRREVEGAIGTLEGTLAAAAAQLEDVRHLLSRVQRNAGATQGAAPAAPEPQPEAAKPADQTAQTAAAPGSQDHHGLDAARAALGDVDVQGYQPEHFAPGLRTPAAPALAGQGFADAAAANGFAASMGGTAMQEKTLRCADCGAMNYPTEWYCEKCGGELAAL